MIQIDVHSEEGNIFDLIARVKTLGVTLGKSEPSIRYTQQKMARSLSYEESMEYFMALFEGEVEFINWGPR